MEAAGLAQDQKHVDGKWSMLLRDYSILIGWVIVCAVFSMIKPSFLSAGNWASIVREMSVISVIAMGFTVVRATGKLDMSLSGVIAASAFTTGAILESGNAGLIAAIAGGVLVGALFGVINGILVGFAGLSEIVVTLGCSFVATGVACLFREGKYIWMTGEQGASLRNLGASSFLGIPPMVIIACLIVLVAYVILQRSLFGRRVYATGNNELAATYSAIDVRVIRLLAYIISGMTSGMGGVLVLARSGVAKPECGTQYFLPVLAATYIGENMYRGLPSIWGTIFGVLIMSTVLNGVAMLNLSFGAQNFVKGIVLLVIVGVAVSQRKSLREK